MHCHIMMTLPSSKATHFIAGRMYLVQEEGHFEVS
jgi:hypothetical protein